MNFFNNEDIPNLPDITNYQINPYFISTETPDNILDNITRILINDKKNFIKASKYVITVFDEYETEEVFYTISLYKILNNEIRIDFILNYGDHENFLFITRKLIYYCRDFDVDNLILDNLDEIFDIGLNYEIDLFNHTLSYDEFNNLIRTFLNIGMTENKYVLVKTIKNNCINFTNRNLIFHKLDLKNKFILCLIEMLNSTDEDILRFALFIIKKFKDDNLRIDNDIQNFYNKLDYYIINSKKEITKLLAKSLLNQHSS
jgi:hypothetical protein